jgi:hypothetical protein
VTTASSPCPSWRCPPASHICTSVASSASSSPGAAATTHLTNTSPPNEAPPSHFASCASRPARWCTLLQGVPKGGSKCHRMRIAGPAWARLGWDSRTLTMGAAPARAGLCRASAIAALGHAGPPPAGARPGAGVAWNGGAATAAGLPPERDCPGLADASCGQLRRGWSCREAAGGDAGWVQRLGSLRQPSLLLRNPSAWLQSRLLEVRGSPVHSTSA